MNIKIDFKIEFYIIIKNNKKIFVLYIKLFINCNKNLYIKLYVYIIIIALK